MSLPSAIVGRLTAIPRAQTHDVVREPLRIAMDDGAVLLADRWVARATRHEVQPTVLVRSPYGRHQVFGLIFGRLLAERGLQVVVQSVRGTFGSEGTFSPFDERADGLATLHWIRQQTWHAERIAMVGPSYLGLVQWAAAPDAGDDLAALTIQVSASQFHGQTYAGGSLSLETAASWLVLIAAQERRLAPLAIARAIRGLPRLCSELPLGELDALATGAEVAWFREAMASPLRDDAYWVARDYAAGVDTITAPVQLVGGWYDIFLPWMLDDFVALQAAGRTPQLIVGPWSHTSPSLVAAGTREALGWLRAHLLDDDRLVRDAAVRLFVTGEPQGGGWRDLPSWPPPGSGERRLWLAGDGRLLEQTDPAPAEPGQTGARDGTGASEAADAGAGDRFRYDPAHPTPSLGGPVLLTRRPVCDNRRHEARADVLTYTTAPLPATIEAIGPVRVALRVRSSSPHFDLFARVCDVDRDGASWNVCDALARVAPERFECDGGGVWHVGFDLWPIGHRFAAGHRVRLQVSAGAHPRYARNPGTGDDPTTATELRAVEIEVLHGAEHRSVLVLPRGDGPAP
ncbi:MAG: CocE/NonD family hydrolase [Solirubrobacteraceae bacterium]|nr:CocE/NonD family hydrolase [Solirubrobacteraceae bacterium]